MDWRLNQAVFLTITILKETFNPISRELFLIAVTDSIGSGGMWTRFQADVQNETWSQSLSYYSGTILQGG